MTEPRSQPAPALVDTLDPRGSSVGLAETKDPRNPQKAERTPDSWSWAPRTFAAMAGVERRTAKRNTERRRVMGTTFQGLASGSSIPPRDGGAAPAYSVPILQWMSFDNLTVHAIQGGLGPRRPTGGALDVQDHLQIVRGEDFTPGAHRPCRKW